MTMTDHSELRRLAEAVPFHSQWYTADELSKRCAILHEDGNLIAAANPKAILEVLDERDALSADLEKVQTELDTAEASRDAALERLARVEQERDVLDSSHRSIGEQLAETGERLEVACRHIYVLIDALAQLPLDRETYNAIGAARSFLQGAKK